MPLSPKTDQMMQAQQGAPDEQQIFESSFSDMAQSSLINKFPELAPLVTTFKVIHSDVDSGSAVGAFILQKPTGLVYIPVILADNQLKPLEIMYAKDYDAFVPLNSSWLAEIDRGSLADMGEGVKTPESLYTDVDIRNLVVPPITGRYSYASATDLKLPDFLAQSDNATKDRFIATLESDHGLLKVAVAIYGKQTLVDALAKRQEKVASATDSYGGALMVATKATGPNEMSKMFGSEAPIAMRGVAVKGYYAKDTRKNLKRPVNTESTSMLQALSASGAYKLYKTDGSAVTAFVVSKPILFDGNLKYLDAAGSKNTFKHQRKMKPRAMDSTMSTPDAYFRDRAEKVIGISSDGDCLELNDSIIGEVVTYEDLTGAAKQIFSDAKAPAVGDYGFFFRNRSGNHPEATWCLHVKSITTGSDGVKRIKAEANFYSVVNIVIDPKNPVSRIIMPHSGNYFDSTTIFVPTDFKWIKCTGTLTERDFISEPDELTSKYLDKLAADGAVSVSVGANRLGDVSINGAMPVNKLAALISLAKDYHISLQDAETVLKEAEDKGHCRVLVSSVESLSKLAADDDKKKEKKKSPPPDAGDQQDPSMGGGMDPSMAGMDPNAMAMQQGMPPGMGMAPPPPSPVDQAVQELQEEIARQHDEQMRLMQQKMEALQAVSSRANEIAQGVPKDQSPTIQTVGMTASSGAGASAMGAPPAPPPPGSQPVMGGAMGMPQQGMMDPSMGQPGMPQPGMQDPSMQMQGQQGMMDPSMGQPGMDPSMGQPGMDPSMQMQGQPGMPQDPSVQMQGQPGAMGGQPQGPVDPTMMHQAMGLADPSLFDASAIGSLAEHSSLKELVGNYLPTLEKSLDNLGRILVTLWIKSSELRTELGEEVYGGLEDKLSMLFRGMGELVLKLNQSTMVLDHGTENGLGGPSSGLM